MILSVLPLETLSSLNGSYQTPKQTWGILLAFLTHTCTNRQAGIHTQSPLCPFVQWDLHSRITEIAFYQCVGKREDFPWKHGRTHHRTKTHSRAIEYQEKHQIVLPCWRHGPSFIPISHIGYKMFGLNLKGFLCVWPWSCWGWCVWVGERQRKYFLACWTEQVSLSLQP